MKRFIYIGILFLAVALASCSKDALIIQDEDRETPEWTHDCVTKGISTQNGGSLGPDITDDGADEGGITDPNNDPDGRKKKP